MADQKVVSMTSFGALGHQAPYISPSQPSKLRAHGYQSR